MKIQLHCRNILVFIDKKMTNVEIQVRDNHGALTFFNGNSSDNAVEYALRNNGWKISINGHRFVKYVVGEISESFSLEDIKRYFPGTIPSDGDIYKMYDIYWRDEPLNPDLYDEQTREFKWDTPFITTSELCQTLSNLSKN